MQFRLFPFFEIVCRPSRGLPRGVYKMKIDITNLTKEQLDIVVESHEEFFLQWAQDAVCEDCPVAHMRR